MTGEKRIEEVTCPNTRLLYYCIAFQLSFIILFQSIYTLWFGIDERFDTMPKYVYAILSAANIPYLGMVIRCLRRDVPVPTYRLGVEGRFNFFVAVMIFMYCVSYNVQDKSKIEASLLGLILIGAGISIVQLSCPVEDFTVTITLCTIELGSLFAILGAIGSISWSSFIVSLFFFPISGYIINVLDPLEQLDDHDSQRDMSI